eukprot:TRINITY_DN13814_c0_g1_i1.p2 TRINITY_DN13814_c0_g1~~TRINITY_DN13814_c0_g1_i1.p2  ORF type:complete len:248 (+),score=60.64 TRINITY_DN13814_c0_g1_i1:82-825(+)
MRQGIRARRVAITTADGVRLAATAAAPTAAAGRPPLCCIITHPYGMLGGDQENPVVQGLWELSVALGCSAVRFDFRGVGRSDGRGTWRGGGEQEDVRAVARWALADDALWEGCGPGRRRVLLIGYSFGALVAGSVAAELGDSLGGFAAVGYPLSVGWFLTLGRTGDFTRGLLAARCPRLLVHGSADNFTGVGAIRSFAGGATPPIPLQVLEDADHFFASRRSMAALEGVIERFITDCSSKIASVGQS